MKVKYYLRGLGTGILVTTLILLVAYSYRNTKGDGEEPNTTGSSVEQSASESNSSKKDETASLTESTTPSETVSTETTPSETVSTETTPNEMVSTETTPMETETTAEKTTEPSTEETTTPVSSSTVTTVTFTVRRGASSLEVANQLQALGVIDNAADFDRFLVNNGYSRRVKMGEHTVEIGMTYEELAEIIASN